MKKKHDRAKHLFSVILFTAWIGFMATAGFFIPSFLPQIPIFQIREVVIKGNRVINFEDIKPVIEELGTNLVNLNETQIRKELNARFKGRIKRVYLEKEFHLNGMTLNITIEERVPVAKVKLGKSYVLIDREGIMFKPLGDDLKELPEIRTYDIEELKDNFRKLYRNVFSLDLDLKRVYVKRDRTVLQLRTKKVILPPIGSLSEEVSSRLKLIYNFPEEVVDLRYGRFILVKN